MEAMTPEELWQAHMKRESRKTTRELILWLGVTALGAIGMAAAFYFGH
jgi:hypothetical protein